MLYIMPKYGLYSLLTDLECVQLDSDVSLGLARSTKSTIRIFPVLVAV